MESPDRALLEAARQGDERAIRALYDRHASAVYSVARRMLADEMLAEDAAQEAWIRALEALDRFRGEASFSTWVHRIAINCALQLQRKRGRLETREEPLTSWTAATLPRERPLLRVRLERAIEALPDGMRLVLVLHDVEGYTHDEIGGLLGIADGTSKSQLSKARGRLRRTLDADAHPASGALVGVA